MTEPLPDHACGVCPNCGQWQHKSTGDCLHECKRRGFVPEIPSSGIKDYLGRDYGPDLLRERDTLEAALNAERELRLKSWSEAEYLRDIGKATQETAADRAAEITALRAQVAKLRAALGECRQWHRSDKWREDPDPENRREWKRHGDAIDAALAETEPRK